MAKKISTLADGGAAQSGDVTIVLRNGFNYRATLGFATAAQGSKADTALQPGSVTQYTDEMAQDAVGAILADTATIDFSYDDAGNAITAALKDGSVTRAKLADGVTGYTSVNPAAVTLDGATDAAVALQAELDRIAGLGGGTLKLVSAAGIYLNAAVQLSSYTALDLSECPVFYGASGALWIVGEIAETPALNKPKLYADIAAGATSFDVVIQGGNVTPAPGQQFILRGQRDATGAHLGKESGYIQSVLHVGTVSGGERWTITPASPVAGSYSVRYTGDAYELATGNNDTSTFTVAAYSAFSGDVTAGVTSATVSDGTLFAVGDYVHVSDNETVGDSTSTADTNPIHNEINRIVAISSNTLTFEAPLYHGYTTAHKGGVSKINAAIGARIIRPRATYKADGGTGAYPFRLKYAVNSAIEFPEVSYATVAGVNVGPYAQGYRLEYARNCHLLFPRYTGKPDAEIYSSAQGYGVVFHGCTDCKAVGAYVKNARHGVLFQYGAAGNEYAHFHDEGSRISAVDFHGINAVKNHVHGGTIVGGPLSTPDSTNKVAIKIGNTSHIYGDHGNVVENVTVWNYSYSEGSAGGIGLQLLSQSRGNLIRNVVVDGCDYGIKLVDNSTYPTSVLPANTFSQVVLRNCTVGPFNIDGGTNSAIDGIVFDRVVSDGNSKHFEFANAANLTLLRPVIRNPVPSSGRYAVKSTNVTGLKVLGGVFDGANRGVSLKQSPAARVIDNLFLNQAEATVFNDDTSAGNNDGYFWEYNSYGGGSYTKTLGSSINYTITDRGAGGGGGLGSAVTGISAAGTNQSGATQLTGDTAMQVVSTGTSNQGVRLPSSTAASMVTVVNVTGNTIKVYPQSGGQIDAQSVNAALSVASNGIITFFGKDLSNNWYSHQGVKFSSTALATLTATGSVGTSSSVARADHSHPVMDTGSGAPATTPADGAIYLDTLNSRLYVRTGGAWKSAALT